MQNKFVYLGIALAVVLASTAGAIIPTKVVRAEVGETLVSPVSIIISAVQITGGTGKTSNDFIELYNPNSEPVNLNGYRLVKRTAQGLTDSSIKSWSTDSYIPAQSFYLWANSSYIDIAITPDVVTSSTLADDNGVALRFGALDSGQLVDSVAWGTTSNTFSSSGQANPEAGQSVVRTSFMEPRQYIVQPSAPRNTTVQFVLPELPVEPVVEPPVVEEPPIVEEPPLPTDPPVDESVPGEEPVPTDEPVTTDESVVPKTIRITEILPDPVGVDNGQEIVELFNYGSESVSLNGWTLDDIAFDQPLSSNAYKFASLIIEAGQYVAITIPEGKFTLNNSSGDILTLFDFEGQKVDTMSYETAVESEKSYGLLNGLWSWGIPSFGSANSEAVVPEEVDDETTDPIVVPVGSVTIPVISGLIITEIYPNPAKGSEEFVEFYNSSNEAINLSGGVLVVGTSKVSLPNVLIDSQSYFVLTGDMLTAPLANGGKEIKLIQKAVGVEDSAGLVVYKVEYKKAPQGQSFSKFEDNYLWTLKVTPNLANVLEQITPKQAVKNIVAAIKKSVAKQSAVNNPATKKVTAKKVTATKTAKAPAKKTTSTNTSKPATSTKSSSDPVQTEQKPKSGPMGAVAIAIASLGAGGLAVYRFGMGGGMPF